MIEDLNLIFEPTSRHAFKPEYNHSKDSGIDVFACIVDNDGNIIPEGITLELGQVALVRTGFKVEIPEGWDLQVRPRSGISYRSYLRIANSPGTIDQSYKDEICIIMHNASPLFPNSVYDVVSLYGIRPNVPAAYNIQHGDKIAQLIPSRRYKASIEIGQIDTKDDRGGGLGHSGTKSKNDAV